jgi:hypothetical protein
MILAEKLKSLICVGPGELTEMIQRAGYKKDSFFDNRFMGLTNGGQFCYVGRFMEDGEEQEIKVFLSYDPANSKVTASY